MENASEPVVVVGGGPTGLMLACELARRGVAVRVLEAREQRAELSKALGVHARTLEVFAELGIAEAALAKGRPLGAANVYSDGERVAHVTLDRLSTQFPFVLILPQWQTEELLESKLRELGVTIERGVRVTSVWSDSEGAIVQADRADHTETLRAQYVVGCDGAHSTLRHAIGVPFEGGDYPERFALADLQVEWSHSFDEAHAFLSSDGLCAVFPLPTPGWVRVAADVSNLPDPALTPAFFAELMSARGAGTVKPGGSTWRSAFEIHRRIAPTFRRGRVFLAGDAAHVHSPAGGQGMNLGLQDAFNLGWKLAAVLQGRADDTLLDTYDAERRPVARATLRGTDFATRIGMWNKPLSRAVRGRVAGWLSQIDAVQDRITRTVAELDVHYRHSPIALEDTSLHLRPTGMADRILFARGPRAGDRAPEVPLPRRVAGEPAFLHDRLAGSAWRILVLVATPDDAGQASRVAHALAGTRPDTAEVLVVVGDSLTGGALRWDGDTLIDETGEVQRAYGAAGSCVYAIRPDGYIGFRTDRLDAAAVDTYFDRVLAPPTALPTPPAP